MLLHLVVPGGIELLVILLMALIMFGLPLVLLAVLGGIFLRSNGDGYDDRIAELETEVEQLRRDLRAGDEDSRTDESTDRIVESSDRTDESTDRIDESSDRTDESTDRIDESSDRIGGNTDRNDEE